MKWDFWIMKICFPVTFLVLRMVRKSSFWVLLASPSRNIISYFDNLTGKVSFLWMKWDFLIMKKCVPVTFSVLRTVRKSTFWVLLACPSGNIFSYYGNLTGKVSFLWMKWDFWIMKKMCPRDIFSFKNGQKINLLSPTSLPKWQYLLIFW